MTNNPSIPPLHVYNDRVGGRGFDIPLPADLSFDDRRIPAGIRPEYLKHDDTYAAMLHGTVRTVEYLGSRSLVRVDVGDFLVSAFLTLQ